MDRAYKIEDAAGVAQYRAVVAGAANGGCKKPGAENAPEFLGITQEAQENQNRGVALRRDDYSYCLMSGSGDRGDLLGIANTDGALKSVQTVVDSAPGTASVKYIVAQAEADFSDGDVIEVWINPFVVKTAAS